MTLLYRAGVDPLKAMKIVGHSEYQTTADIYTHLDQEMLRATADDMAEEYHFNARQKKLLEELLSPEYDELFDALTAGGAVTIEDIQEGGLESLDAILRQFFDSSSVLKDALSDLPRHTWKIHMDALRKRLSTGWDAMRKTQSQQS